MYVNALTSSANMGKRKNYDLELSFFESLHRRMPKDQRVVGMLAQIYTKTGQIDLGLKMDRKLVRLRPNDPISHYNLACSLALKERRACGAMASRKRLGTPGEQAAAG